MPVGFLTQEQRDGFGRYVDSPSREELERYFHLSDEDREAIQVLRGNHNRLGYAVLLTTVRFVGVLPDKPAAVPVEVLQVLCRQLAIPDPDCLQRYSDHRRWIHATDIQNRFGYRHFTDPGIGFRLSRWLYALCWTGTDRPGVLFERATSWLFTQKVLLPGVSQLERFIAQLRSRVEERLWFTLGRSVTEEQRLQLQDLLTVAEGNRSSRLDQLRSGPVMVSGPALIRALRRLDDVRGIGITLPAAAHIPPSRIAALARFANTAKVTAINRLPASRRMATLVAFALCLEATAHDDALEVLEALLRDLFSNAEKADKKARMRSLKDLDRSAATLAAAFASFLATSAFRLRLADGLRIQSLAVAQPQRQCLGAGSRFRGHRERGAPDVVAVALRPRVLAEAVAHDQAGGAVEHRGQRAPGAWCGRAGRPDGLDAEDHEQQSGDQCDCPAKVEPAQPTWSGRPDGHCPQSHDDHGQADRHRQAETARMVGRRRRWRRRRSPSWPPGASRKTCRWCISPPITYSTAKAASRTSKPKRRNRSMPMAKVNMRASRLSSHRAAIT